MPSWSFAWRRLFNFRGVARRVATAAAMLVVASAVTAAAPAEAQQDGLSDVEAGSHKPAIDMLNELGLFKGTLCGEETFCAAEPIKRSTMAVWLIRALEDEEPPAVATSRFADVADDEWWAHYVERLAELEITAGCKTEPLRYCPANSVTRGQMASFLVAAFDLEPAEPAGFVDTAGSSHEATIDSLAAAKITAGCTAEPLRYCPANSVTRGQMATFLAQALGLVGTPETTSDSGEYVAVSAGGAWSAIEDAPSRFSCGLRGDGTIRCWGSNDFGQTNTPAGTYSSIAVGGYHSCAIAADQGVTCWGGNSVGQLSVPGSRFREFKARAITSGRHHSCMLTTEDAVRCWGLIYGEQADPPAGIYRAVAAGGAHTCAIRDNGTIICWGENSSGQVDAPEGAFVEVTAGWHHSCARSADGTVVCWGHNGVSQTDTPEETFSMVSAGGSHTCGLRTDGTVTCWGSNFEGQSDAPPGTYSAISASEAHSCGLRTEGSIVCWGDNEFGQTSTPE